MALEYVGAVILEVDGQEIECLSINDKTLTGRKLVKTMNKTGRAKGHAQGIAEYQLNLQVVIPLSGDIDWDAIDNAKVTLEPLDASGQRVSYLGCFTLEVGAQYTVDNEAVRDIQMGALRKVRE